jgi:hypothetical protein
MSYEYKVVPAPTRGLKAKGVKTAEDRFANALQTAMNEQASDGWEYLRTDTLPSEQREGLMSKTTVYQNMLVFRRSKEPVRPAIRPPEPPIAAIPPKSGEERVTETKKLIAPQPPTPPKAQTVDAPGKKPDSSTDAAAE